MTGMRLHIRQAIDSAINTMGKSRLDKQDKAMLGFYKFTLVELSRNLERLAQGEVSLDDFCHAYVLTQSKDQPSRESGAKVNE